MTTELVPYEKFVISAEKTAKIRKAMQDNLEGSAVGTWDFDRIKVPCGGSTTWEIERQGETESLREFDVIVLHAKLKRAYWSHGLDQGGTAGPPDCSSEDTEHGMGVPGGDCATCPMAEWNSDPKGGRGQACKTRNILIVRLPGSLIPQVLSLPPTSLKPWRRYAFRLGGQGLSYYEVVTRFVAEKHGQGPTGYAIAVPSMIAELPKDMAAEVEAFREQFIEAFRAVRIEADDVAENGSDI